MYKMTYLAAIVCVVALFSIVAGCVSGTANEQSTAGSEIIAIDGSAPMYPVIAAAASDYMGNHSGVKIAVFNGGNNTASMQKLIRNGTQISDDDQPVTDSEYQEGLDAGVELHMTQVGFDAVCVIVNPAIPVADLNVSQLDSIFFTGNITDWGQLTNGTYNGTIDVYGIDPSSSGDAEQFNRFVTGNTLTPYVPKSRLRLIDADVASSVAGDKNGIGFASLKFTGAGVKVVSVNSVYPSADTLRDTTYPIALHLYMVTRGLPGGLTKDFINYMLGEQGQKDISNAGFISIM